MAWSKTFGKSFAPGGNCDLLGLPCGVAVGDVKPCPPGGVEGDSALWSLPWRAYIFGGGIGRLKSSLGLVLPPRGERGTLVAIVAETIKMEEGKKLCLASSRS